MEHVNFLKASVLLLDLSFVNVICIILKISFGLKQLFIKVSQFSFVICTKIITSDYWAVDHLQWTNLCFLHYVWDNTLCYVRTNGSLIVFWIKLHFSNQKMWIALHLFLFNPFPTDNTIQSVLRMRKGWIIVFHLSIYFTILFWIHYSSHHRGPSFQH